MQPAPRERILRPLNDVVRADVPFRVGKHIRFVWRVPSQEDCVKSGQARWDLSRAVM